jgi:hypothetical protein
MARQDFDQGSSLHIPQFHLFIHSASRQYCFIGRECRAQQIAPESELETDPACACAGDVYDGRSSDICRRRQPDRRWGVTEKLFRDCPWGNSLKFGQVMVGRRMIYSVAYRRTVESAMGGISTVYTRPWNYSPSQNDLPIFSGTHSGKWRE